jgi:hypothetical protein
MDSSYSLVLVIGDLLFAQALFISAKVSSSAYLIKKAVALSGLVVLFVAEYLRPLKEAPEGK